MSRASDMTPTMLKGKDPRLVLVCDHASNAVPADMPLGVADAHMQDHIAYDIGAAALTRTIAGLMGASAVMAPASRLVIDCNRPLDHPTLIPKTSDGVLIPGNNALTESQRQARITQLYHPFHDQVAGAVKDACDQGATPLVIGVHSFTPSLDGKDRPFDVGLLWNNDPRLAQALIGLFERETDFTIGDNQPYSGKDLYHTMQVHGADHGLPQTTLEVRNNHLLTSDHVMAWARLLAVMLDECFTRHDLISRQYFT